MKPRAVLHEPCHDPERVNSEAKMHEQYCNLVRPFLALDERSAKELVDWIKSLPAAIKRRSEFIIGLAVKAGYAIADVFKLFLDRTVWAFFAEIGWSFHKLHKLIAEGFKHYQHVIGLVAEYTAQTRVGKWTEDELRKLDDWLLSRKFVKRLSGVAVAGMLAFIWFNMTFTGDPTYDFDLEHLVEALRGRFSLADIFSGKDGHKLLMLFVTGASLGISFPWTTALRSEALFSAAVLESFARHTGKRLHREPVHLHAPPSQHTEESSMDERVKGSMQLAGMSLFVRVKHADGRIEYVADMPDLARFRGEQPPPELQFFLTHTETAKTFLGKSKSVNKTGRQLWGDNRFYLDLEWQDERHRYEPDFITTGKDWRRQGWASTMWSFVKKAVKKYMGLDIAHSSERTRMGSAWVKSMSESSSLRRNCPECLPGGGKGDFDFVGSEKSSDGKSVRLYRCRNCTHEIKVKKRGPIKRGSPSQKKTIDRIRKIVDDERYDIEEMDERPDTNDVWLRIVPKRWHDSNGTARIGPGGAFTLITYSVGAKRKEDRGRAAWNALEVHFGIFGPSQDEDFDDLMGIIRKNSKKSGPEVEKVRQAVRDQFEKESWLGKGKIINQLVDYLKDHGVKVTRNKRKRFVTEGVNDKPQGVLIEMGAERTLYHGTWKGYVPKIRKEGLVPTLGDFVSDMYGMEIDRDELENEAVVFFADRRNMDNCVGAMRYHISKKVPGFKWLTDVTLEDVRKHGALVVVKEVTVENPKTDYDVRDRGFHHRPQDDEDMNFYANYPASVEPGDYYASDTWVDPSIIMTGSKMMSFLRSNGALRDFMKVKRERLVAILKRTGFQKDAFTNPVQQVRAMSDDQVLELLRTLIRQYHLREGSELRQEGTSEAAQQAYERAAAYVTEQQRDEL